MTQPFRFAKHGDSDVKITWGDDPIDFVVLDEGQVKELAAAINHVANMVIARRLKYHFIPSVFYDNHMKQATDERR